MIDEIQVENLALIHEGVLEPSRGLTVLTGETGAGKSALLSALKLLLGERADKDSVREGEDELVVLGRFLGISTDDGASGAGGEKASDFDVADEIVVMRRVSAEGRSRAHINGRMVSVSELAQTVAPTVDLCGQHEHQRLMQVSTHMHMLDAWAGVQVTQAYEAYEHAFLQAAAAEKELARLRHADDASSAKLDEARFVLQRIDVVDPHEGEYDELIVELAKAEHAEALATALGAAHEALAGDGGAADALGSAVSALDEAVRYDVKLGEYGNALREAGYVLEDMTREICDYRDGVEFDPETLAWKQERVSALQGLLRTYGPRMADVFAHRAEAAEIVSLVDDAAERRRVAQKTADEAESALEDAACALDAARFAAAPCFAAAVTKQMGRLEMDGAELICSFKKLERSAWTKTGSSTVEFLFRPGVGMQARPLARIASGGEISRVMLAIKVVLGKSDNVDTLVFDEVDAGIGGSAALALAEVLVDLARTHQVIVVTHLAQVAVCGKVHYAISKVMGHLGMPETKLRRLSDDERPAEIARMLSGDVTATSLAHAREMLKTAQREVM